MCDDSDSDLTPLPTFFSSAPAAPVAPVAPVAPAALEDQTGFVQQRYQRNQLRNQQRIATRHFRSRGKSSAPYQQQGRQDFHNNRGRGNYRGYALQAQQQPQPQPQQPRPAHTASVTISNRSLWCVPINLSYFSQVLINEAETQETVAAMTSVRESLTALKNRIQEESVWPDVWRQVIEANWVLGRINQACLLRPFSRAFFKLVELNHVLSIIPSKLLIPNFSAICLGEAPGGFVHAISWCRSLCFSDGPWLLPDDPHSSYSVEIVSLPEDTWSEQLNTPLARSHIHGINLVSDVASRELFCRKFAASADLVTGDAGFEVPQDRRSEQEQEMLSLIRAELDVALQLLKPNGTLVLKFFAIDCQETRELLMRIFSSFENCSLCMPVASKPSNDERYVVGRNFRGLNVATIPLDSTWNRWFDYYSFEDKLRQRDPLTSALDLCRTMTASTRLPLEPALGYAKAYCAELGLPVKQIFLQTPVQAAAIK